MGRLTLTVYRCKGCSADMFLSREDMAEHVVDCEPTDPKLRTLAREWLAARQQPEHGQEEG